MPSRNNSAVSARSTTVCSSFFSGAGATWHKRYGRAVKTCLSLLSASAAVRRSSCSSSAGTSRCNPGERLRLQSLQVSKVAFVEAVHSLGDVLNLEQMVTRGEQLRCKPINLGS